MAEFTHTPSFIIAVERCHDCRHFYGFEKHERARCPHCASASVSRLIDETERLERSNRSLRGALKRKSRP